MKSPTPPRVADSESTIRLLVTPTVRILIATIVLITGAGVAAVFWKMPKTAESHALYHEGVIDQDLAAVPLPHELAAAVSPEEMKLISLSMLDDVVPIVAEGVEKYAQVYPVPESLAAVNAVQGRIVPEKEIFAPAAPQRFEPMREVIDEKPISVEPVSQEFLPTPVSASTVERSDEFVAAFHFVENSRSVFGNVPEQPSDPFPEMVAGSPAASPLQPLQPLQLDKLSPLLPLREIDFRPLPALIVQ